MTRKAILSLLAAAFTSTLFAAEGPVPKGARHLDHVFVIMMENHGYGQIVGNPNAPFINKYAVSANVATNYFAIAHPSLTNYLEVVGGSNFGVLNDNAPDWHNPSCITNLQTGTPSLEGAANAICPIEGTGTDAATPAIDYSNETSGPPGDININGTAAFPAATDILGITIADQLVAAHKSWKSYQENLPVSGADRVNYSDGFYPNNTDFSQIFPALNPPLSSSDVVQLYAVKHNPFAYFSGVQGGANPHSSLKNVAGFETLYADLGSGNVPSYSLNCSEPMQRPAWTRQGRGFLQLRSDQRRKPGWVESSAHLSRRRHRTAVGDGD
jgi:phosphatidylinositol-3-phosphatase